MLQKVLRGRDLTGPELDLRKLGYFRQQRPPYALPALRDLGMFTGSDAIEGGIKPSSSSEPSRQACTILSCTLRWGRRPGLS
jgi:hypothetical protein